MYPKNCELRKCYTVQSEKSLSGKQKRQGDKETMTGVPTTWINKETETVAMGCNTLIIPTATKDLKPSKQRKNSLKKLGIKTGYNANSDTLVLTSSNGWCFERNLLQMSRHVPLARSMLSYDPWYGWKLWHPWELRLAQRLCYGSMFSFLRGNVYLIMIRLNK